MDTERMLALFLAEGRDLLARVDADLQLLASAPSARGAQASMFRALHSLKGMSATVGFDDAATALHAAESLLEAVRERGVLERDERLLLVEVGDALRGALDAAEQGIPPDARLVELTLRLTALTPRAPAVRGPRTRDSAARTVQRATSVEGASWRVDVRIADDAAMPSARATLVQRRLAVLAPVLRVSPAADAQRDDAWDRTLTLWLGHAADVPVLDAALIERTVRSAGEVTECQVAREVERRDVPARGHVRTVRIPVDRLDDLLDLIGELVLARDRLVRSVPDSHAEARQAVDDASRLITQLRDAVLVSRMVPLSEVFDRFPRHVRETAQALGKDIDLVLEGRELEVDRSLLDELSDPILHLLRNAVDHGLETPDERVAGGKPAQGRLVVRATRDGSMVAVTVADDGRGVDRAQVAARATAHGVSDADALVQDDQGLLELLAMPGLSTAASVTALSGRGVGVDAVLSRVQALGGRLDLATAAGTGTAITLRLPLSVAMLRALLVRVAGETYAIPLSMVHATHRAESLELHAPDSGSVEAEIAGEVLRVISLRSHLGLPPVDDVYGHLVVLEGATGRLGLYVDACTSQQEIVVKPLQRVRGAARMFSGGTILPDGTPSLILDINTLP